MSFTMFWHVTANEGCCHVHDAQSLGHGIADVLPNFSAETISQCLGTSCHPDCGNHEICLITVVLMNFSSTN